MSLELLQRQTSANELKDVNTLDLESTNKGHMKNQEIILPM
jgi:hypothetical protein